ncbi:hypothetical protein BYT27DRAFT_7341050 [Phlegmacium glaucopus]|nr:hypothetical protein BYT27DRAFT_7341050 [Phlegmacium glaucopus]
MPVFRNVTPKSQFGTLEEHIYDGNGSWPITQNTNFIPMIANIPNKNPNPAPPQSMPRLYRVYPLRKVTRAVNLATFLALAEVEKKVHRAKYPNYVYSPRDSTKRKGTKKARNTSQPTPPTTPSVATPESLEVAYPGLNPPPNMDVVVPTAGRRTSEFFLFPF